MRLDFNVLWVDDQPNAVNAQITRIKTLMAEEGFSFNPTQCQSIRITTVVKYHNSLGKVYFFFIRPFHALICKWLLKRAARNWGKENTHIVK